MKVMPDRRERRDGHHDKKRRNKDVILKFTDPWTQRIVQEVRLETQTYQRIKLIPPICIQHEEKNKNLLIGSFINEATKKINWYYRVINVEVPKVNSKPLSERAKLLNKQLVWTSEYPFLCHTYLNRQAKANILTMSNLADSDQPQKLVYLRNSTILQFLDTEHRQGMSIIAFIEKDTLYDELYATFIEIHDPFKKVKVEDLDQYKVERVHLPREKYRALR